jgi:DNA-binding NarL/FixJ family response regulator
MSLKRILLVEDEQGAVIIFKRISKTAWESSHGELEFIIVHTLADARKVIRESHVDVFLFDLTLDDSTPDNSISVIENEHNILPPIVVCTGNEALDIRRRCLDAGAQGFALKKHIFQSPNFFFAEVYNIWHLAQRNNDHGSST